MTSGDLIPGKDDQAGPAANEVQFALVIAKMIDSVKTSPTAMREAIYELARYKLQEQFTQADAKNVRRTQQALETAIRGVEEFSKKEVSVPALDRPAQVSVAYVAPPMPRAPPASPLARELTAQVRPKRYLDIAPDTKGLDPQSSSQVSSSKASYPGVSLPKASDPSDAFPKSSHPLWSRLKRAAWMIAIFVGILLAIQHRENLIHIASALPKIDWQAAIKPPAKAPQISNAAPAPSAPTLDSTAPAPPPGQLAPLRPTDYGVYAVSDDTLVALQQLPGRPPDMRVAVSAAIKTPSQTRLATVHPKFIVFRRDLASNSSDHAEVRVIAKIAREFSADAAGKKPGDNEWVMRNVAFQFRASPVTGRPDMYELHSEDPALELTPGRYAIVLKDQAYDFSVEGQPVDSRQCIERIIAATGTFYTDCKKP